MLLAKIELALLKFILSIIRTTGLLLELECN